MLLSTRLKAYPFCQSPYDFYRYEPSDTQSIFSNRDIIDSEEKYDSPGVFVKVNKPDDFAERGLSK
jgi:hypothetical protein